MNNITAGEQLATSIAAHLKEDNRSVAWLANEIGIPYPTLWRKLRKRPEKLELHNIIAIAIALNTPPQELLFPQVSA